MKIKNASFYFAGDIVEKLIPFILIPILTRYLSADDYGYAGVAISIFRYSLSLLPLILVISWYSLKKEVVILMNM